MTSQFSQIKWVRVILTALVVYVLSLLLVTLVITVYAGVLGFQARGAPDPTLITAFANQNAAWIGPVSLLLFTLFGAWRVARRVESALALHGIVLGALTGLVNLLFDGFVLSTFITLALTIAAGWLGSKLGARK